MATSSIPHHIAIFASGTGSNAKKIIEYFRDHSLVQVVLVVSNNVGAGALDIARENQIPVLIVDKEKFFRGNAYKDELEAAGIEFIVLAGFLWKIPSSLVAAYRNKIVNIHPALLPKYGGKGMYGNTVHEAVIGAGEKESGITIHYVDEIYDHGRKIFQITCPVLPEDTSYTLAQRIHILEHKYYPQILERLITGTFSE